MLQRRTSFVLLFTPIFAAALYACGSSDATTTAATTTVGATTSVSASSTTSESATTSTSASSTTATSSSATTSTGAGGSGGSGGSATGGAGGAGGGFVWPTCDMQPPNSATKTINEIWQDNPAMPTHVWIPGVYVTAVSGSACVAGTACQIFVQQAETFADIAAGSQQAIKMFISANTAKYFTTIAVGDQVDASGYAWRYNVNGENELLVQVNLQLEGCAKKVGTGNPQPVTVTLDDLSVTSYEDTMGPLLVKVDAVSGKPGLPSETFGLHQTGVFNDAGIDTVTSLSPYMLPGGVFNGLVTGKTHDFTSVTGVFGLFIPNGTMMKFEEIYPRADAEYPVLTVH